MSEQQPETFEADGTRPIKSTDMEIVDTFEEDGTRPIADSPDFLTNNSPNQEHSSSIKEQTSTKTDNSNSDTLVVNSERQADAALNINEKNSPADSTDTDKVLEIDGERPIVEGHGNVVDTLDIDGERPVTASNLDTDKVLKVDGERPVDNSDVEVVDSFEADGERPIMANKYEVVDTLDIDGERPITSSN